jgi:hypothetical protein
VKAFAQAALHRDKRQDYLSAFRLVASAITGLLADAPHGLTASITQASRYPEARARADELPLGLGLGQSAHAELAESEHALYPGVWRLR